MTTILPVNAHASVPAIFGDFDMDEGVTAGRFHFYKQYGEPDGAPPAGILFGCPCGCGAVNSVGFDTHESQRPRWHWDGNRDTPTLTPSINILQFDNAGNRIGEHWHGWLTNGEFKSC